MTERNDAKDGDQNSKSSGELDPRFYEPQSCCQEHRPIFDQISPLEWWHKITHIANTPASEGIEGYVVMHDLVVCIVRDDDSGLAPKIMEMRDMITFAENLAHPEAEYWEYQGDSCRRVY